MPLNIYMIEKNDWRLHPGDEQIKFPEFWQTSYREKNAFYDMIVAEAKDYFVRFKQGEEFLRGEKVQILWHAHCQFCWQKFTTDMDAECYCTPIGYVTTASKNLRIHLILQFYLKVQ